MTRLRLPYPILQVIPLIPDGPFTARHPNFSGLTIRASDVFQQLNERGLIRKIGKAKVGNIWMATDELEDIKRRLTDASA